MERETVDSGQADGERLSKHRPPPPPPGLRHLADKALAALALGVAKHGGARPDVAALAYDAELRAMAAAGVLGERCGLPSLDLVLLGSGADGHCASLYPESAQVVRDGGRAVAAAAGKGGITLTIPALRAARHVLLSAAKPAQAEMVANALCDSDAATNTASPAGMIVPAPDGDGVVEWLLSEPSAALLPTSDGKD